MYVTIFPLFFSYFSSSSSSSSLLHCTVGLEHDWDWCRVQKYHKKGVGRESRAKMTSFWPIPFKIKRAKTMSFWTQKIKNKNLGFSTPTLCNPTATEEEKEKKKKKKEKKEGVPGRRRVRRPRRALRAYTAPL